MQIMVLNDGETFSSLDGCKIVDVPDGATTEDVEEILELGNAVSTPVEEDRDALDHLAAFLYADPQTFPGGADTCEALDQILRDTGRAPAVKS